jgi:hypothetical protein
VPPSSHRTAFVSRLAPATWWIVLGFVWIVSAAYVWHGLDRGWIPHDEGTLAQSAERVLDGELPHRDFDEVYTGALSFLNAAAFRVFGTTLRSLRLPLFCVFLLWVPALYYVATRFAAPPLAGVVTALGTAWSLPQYTAAMPSWYNLFLATFGTAALLRHIETGRRRWLFAAGVAGGVSCLIKIVGLFYIAAVLTFLVYRGGERTLVDSTPSRQGRRWGAYPIAIGAGLAGFVGLLVWLVRGQLAVPEIVHFVLPGAALAAFVTWECASAEQGGVERWATLLRLVAPFAVGVAIPIALFVIPYLRAGAVAELWGGVFITPLRRLDFAASGLPSAATLLGALPVAMLLGLVPLSRVPARRVWLAVLLVALIAFFILSRHAVWHTIRPLVPLTVIAGVWSLVRHREVLSPLRRQQVLLVLSVTALWSLVQFPFARPIYFFYVAPVAAIAVLAVVKARPSHPNALPFPLPSSVLGLYLLFAVVNTHPNREPSVPLTSARGGLVVGARDAARYDSLVGLLQAHASGGYVYAAPDCPEVAFLAGLRNPTRTIWEFLSDTAGRTERVLAALDEHAVTAVVIKQLPPFSGALPTDLLDSLASRYPRQAVLDRFVVRWRP